MEAETGTERITVSGFVKAVESYLSDAGVDGDMGMVQDFVDSFLKNRAWHSATKKYSKHTDSNSCAVDATSVSIYLDERGFVYGEICNGKNGKNKYVLTGEPGNYLITASGFAKIVNNNRREWSEEYVEDSAMGVLNGEYSSFSPAMGSDVFQVKREENTVMASARPKDKIVHKNKIVQPLMSFELIGDAA